MKRYGVGKFLDILPYASVIGILKPLEKFFESARDPFANNKICHNLFSVKKMINFEGLTFSLQRRANIVVACLAPRG